MNTTLPFVLVAAFGVVACGSKAPSPVPSTEAPPGTSECKHPISVLDCNWLQCGSNSPIANTFPINGVRPDGRCNPEGVQLVPMKMSGGVGDKCERLTLDLQDNKLVGRDEKGEVQCRDDQLKGARFEVRGWDTATPGGPKRRITITIDDVTTYTYPNHATRTAYKMSFQGHSLCTEEGSKAARKELGLAPIEFPGQPEPAAEAQLVIPISSELYDWMGHPVPEDVTHTPLPWNQLACVGDALAKRSLSGLYTDDVAASRAALTMLVANYCGNFHATARGREISWKLFDDSQVPEDDACRLEAKWEPDGAACLSRRPRLLYPDSAQQGPKVPPGLPKWLAKKCTSPDACIDALHICDAPSLSAPKQDKVPTCAGPTPGYRWHSYVDSAECRATKAP